ncbi:hypothetical protein ACIP5Y_17340 [Nocardia sp. NPDC088792]|uniref:hypothetical protein n=1 Tax=Nocardia sp. NPDC088792 TaxID=3364332 RepID=UPI0038258FE5
MIKKSLTVAALAAGALFAIAPLANADDAPVDPNAPADHSSEFVMYTGIDQAKAVQAAGQQVVVGPYVPTPGGPNMIVCRGDGKGVPLYACKQVDAIGWTTLTPVDVPVLGHVWVYGLPGQ